MCIEKQPLVILTGPTAAGKTALSIGLAKAIGGEIISADSMQVYKEMNIGTAKIKAEEMCGIRHYLIDEFSPEDPFSVVIFQQRAKEAIREITGRGHLPIIVGGTGFYIQAILNDIDFSENDDDQTYRHKLEAISKEEGGIEKLYEMLKAVDPESAQKIHMNNVKKIVRALEYYDQTGQKISDHNEEQAQKTSPYNFAYFVLTRPRDVLYKRIDQRIDEMMEEGLIEEVKALKDKGYKRELVSMQGLGYKEILAYLDNELTLDEAVYSLKRGTRHFAKRQLTWFKREKDVIWLEKDSYESEEKILEYILSILKDKKIIENTGE